MANDDRNVGNEFDVLVTAVALPVLDELATEFTEAEVNDVVLGVDLLEEVTGLFTFI